MDAPPSRHETVGSPGDQYMRQPSFWPGILGKIGDVRSVESTAVAAVGEVA